MILQHSNVGPCALALLQSISWRSASSSPSQRARHWEEAWSALSSFETRVHRPAGACPVPPRMEGRKRKNVHKATSVVWAAIILAAALIHSGDGAGKVSRSSGSGSAKAELVIQLTADAFKEHSDSTIPGVVTLLDPSNKQEYAKGQGLLTKMRRLAKAYESKLNFFYLKKGEFADYEKKLKTDSKGRAVVCVVRIGRRSAPSFTPHPHPCAQSDCTAASCMPLPRAALQRAAQQRKQRGRAGERRGLAPCDSGLLLWPRQRNQHGASQPPATRNEPC